MYLADVAKGVASRAAGRPYVLADECRGLGGLISVHTTDYALCGGPAVAPCTYAIQPAARDGKGAHFCG